MRKIYFIVTFCLFFLISSFYKTQSFFTESEVSGVNTFAAASVFPDNGNNTPATGTETITNPNNTVTEISAGDVVINEIYYDPDKDHVIAGGDGANSSEWIELYNKSLKTVNLKNWKIIDNNNLERLISANDRLLNPGEYVILAKSSEVASIWNIPGDIFIPINELFGLGLSNSKDRVILKDHNGQIIDQISYGEDITAFNPSLPDVAQGHSLEREPDGADTDSNADFVNRDTPTPGN